MKDLEDKVRELEGATVSSNSSLVKVNPDTDKKQIKGSSEAPETLENKLEGPEDYMSEEVSSTTSNDIGGNVESTVEESLDLELMYEKSKEFRSDKEFSDFKQLFDYMDNTKKTRTPSQTFELLYKDFYSNPRFKGKLRVRMLTVEEDKIILSCDTARERLLQAVEMSIVDENDRPFSKEELSTLYVQEIEFLYLQYRIHNLDRYYHIDCTCGSCSKTSQSKIDLVQLNINYPKTIDDVESNFLLPMSNLSVKIRSLTIKNGDRVESHIDAIEESQGKMNTSRRLVEVNFTEKAMSVVDINGLDVLGQLDLVKIFLSKLSTSDMLIFNRYVDKLGNDIGIQYSVEWKCPVCGKVSTIFLPLNWEFFRPSL